MRMQGFESALEDTRYDVIVATLVQTASGTHSAPPTLTLAIDEVLRGDPASDRTRAMWLPEAHDVDVDDQAGRDRIAAWGRAKLDGPAVGTKWILLGHVAPPGFHVAAFGREVYTDAQRATAVRVIAAKAGTTATASPAPPASPTTCDLDLRLEGTRRGSGFDLTASVINMTRQPITIELPDRCPHGPLSLTGLPPGYDVHGTCAKGECDPARPKTITQTLPPAHSVPLDRMTIGPKQGCNTPLPDGRYELTFELPAGTVTQATACKSSQFVVEVKAGAMTSVTLPIPHGGNVDRRADGTCWWTPDIHCAPPRAGTPPCKMPAPIQVRCRP